MPTRIATARLALFDEILPSRFPVWFAVQNGRANQSLSLSRLNYAPGTAVRTWGNSHEVQAGRVRTCCHGPSPPSQHLQERQMCPLRVTTRLHRAEQRPFAPQS